MKSFFKIIFFCTVLVITVFHSSAQPSRGIKVGANYTFYKNTNDIEYAALPGFQFGYAWSKTLNESLALSVEGLLTQKSSRLKYTNEEFLVNINEKRNALYISAPVGLNYYYSKACLGGGYEFAYRLSGNLPVNDIDHSLFLQAAYKISFFDVVLKYGISVNKEEGGTVAGSGNYPGDGNSNLPPVTYTPKSGILQLSLIFNLGKK